MLRVAAIEESIANQSQCQCSPVSVAAHDLVDPNLLRTQLEGKLYSASDGFAYDIARSLWNGALSIRPWAVVQPKSVADIQKCLLFPSENKIHVTVKGGGHNFAGHAHKENCLTIDLCNFRTVEIVKEKSERDHAGVVRVGGGCLLRDIDRVTEAAGFVTPLGAVSTTGVGGLALGGGVGWLTPQYGLTCQNVTRVTLVLPNGDLITLDTRKELESVEAELLWALRGFGNGNFGVVLSMDLQLYPLPTDIYRLLIKYEPSSYPEIARIVFDLMGDEQFPKFIAPYLYFDASMVIVGGGAFCPEHIIVQHLSPLFTNATLKPIEKHLLKSTYTELQTMTDMFESAGQLIYCKSVFIKNEIWQTCNQKRNELIDTLMDIISSVPNSLTDSLMIGIEFPWRGAFRDKLKTEKCSFPARESVCGVLFNAHVKTYALYETAKEWCYESTMKLLPFTATMEGIYTNYAASEERRTDIFPAETLARLRQLKRQVDPNVLLIGTLDKFAAE